MRTKKEMYDYLKEKIDEYHIPDIIDRLVKEQLLDDREFAKAFVSTRINTSTKGPQLVKRELIEKGVAMVLAEEAITQYTFEIEYEKAMKWEQKKLRSNKKESYQKKQKKKHKSQKKQKKKEIKQDIIKEVMAEIKQEKDTEQEQEALEHHGIKLIRKHQRKFSGFELIQKVKEGLYRQGFQIDKINDFIEENIKE